MRKTATLPILLLATGLHAAEAAPATVPLPAGVQYAWPHASHRYLYVASSSSASGYGRAGTEHHVTAFKIDPATGALKIGRAHV